MKATTNLPNRNVGYLFSVIFLAYEIYIFDQPDEMQFALMIVISGWLFYLYSVFTVHKVVHEFYNNRYDINPIWGTLAHLIPFFNLYWVHKWPKNLADYVWKVDKHFIYDQKKIPWLMYSGLALTRFDFAIGYALIWTAMRIIMKGVDEFALIKLSPEMIASQKGQRQHT